MTRYRIVTYRGGYAVQYKRWDSLWLWCYHCPGQMDSPPEEYATVADAQAAITNLKRQDGERAQSGEVVWTE